MKRTPLKTETNTPEMADEIAEAFEASDIYDRLEPDSDDPPEFEVFFEHGQHWITATRSGAQWSVVDSNDGFDFEQVTQGDDED